MKLVCPDRRYLIHPFEAGSVAEALSLLQDAHDFLARRASKSLNAVPYWGCISKRLGNVSGEDVDLRAPNDEAPPALIGKPFERFCEVLNITATAQRLIDALKWIAE